MSARRSCKPFVASPGGLAILVGLASLLFFRFLGMGASLLLKTELVLGFGRALRFRPRDRVSARVWSKLFKMTTLLILARGKLSRGSGLVKAIHFYRPLLVSRGEKVVRAKP